VPQHDHAAAGAYFGSAAALMLACVYVTLALRAARRKRWPAARTPAFVAGAALLALGLAPQLLPFGASDFRNHMLQHLLIGMVAPLGLVLGAPVTLLYRSFGKRGARLLARLLGSGYMRVVSQPAAALVLGTGGMALLYATPLYAASLESPWLHGAVHVHFLLAGYLFAWSIAGPDPAPRRPSVPHRLVVLGVAIFAHAAVAQLLYAGLLAVPAPPHELRGGAELMYYGGDLAELALALALVRGWRPGRRPAAAQRSSVPRAAASR